jgi:hypothetical protein
MPKPQSTVIPAKIWPNTGKTWPDSDETLPENAKIFVFV